MFVAVACEFAAEDHRRAAERPADPVRTAQGARRAPWRAPRSRDALGRLKQDIDRVTDSDDSIRFYQYPVDGTLAITVLKEKQWRGLSQE